MEHVTSSPVPVSVWDVFNTCLPDQGADDSPMDSSSSSSTTPAVALGSLALPLPQSVPISAERVHLLAVYQSGVATWMDIFDHNCTYQREIARRCLSSELLMHSVCAFTAKHLSLLPSGTVWSAVAGDYYGTSLRMLIRHLNSELPQDDALTATMLLSSYEMIAAHGHEHQRHFYGAMVLILTRGVSALSSGTDRANFWIYIRHEITVALVNEVPLQISLEHLDVSWPEGEAEEDALGNGLLCLLCKAINVVYRRASPASGNHERGAIHTDAETWLRGLPNSFHGVKYGNLDDYGFSKIYFAVPAAAAAMMSYHLLHILLYAEPTRTEFNQMSQVQYHATQIANIALSDVHQSVRSFSAQALFFAAKHINGIGKKTTMWALLDDIEVRLGFSTRNRVKKLQELVEPGY